MMCIDVVATLYKRHRPAGTHLDSSVTFSIIQDNLLHYVRLVVPFVLLFPLVYFLSLASNFLMIYHQTTVEELS